MDTFNDILQITAVIVLLILCVVWIVRRIRGGSRNDCESDSENCAGCVLSEKCRKNNRKRSG